MASSRGRYSLTTSARTNSSSTSSSSQQQQQQQQQRPSRRDPINIAKNTGSSIPSTTSSASSSSSSSTSSSSFSYSTSLLSSNPPSSSQHHHEVPSAFRRSMSPIGGAAFAMRNFLRRKRGNTLEGNNQTSNDMEAASPHNQSHQYRNQQQQQQQRPSLTMQSFVLVEGADTTTTSKTATAPTVIYDIDEGSFSDSEPASVSASRCQSPVPAIITTNLSSPSTTTYTFSQAMKSRFGRERTPTSPPTPTPTGTPTVLSPSSSFRRSRSRNPSAPGTETLANGTGGGGPGLLATTAASMRKKLNRRSLSADSLPFSSSSSSSSVSPPASSLPRPLKTKGQAQAQKLANAQGVGGGRAAKGGDIPIGMSMRFSGSNVGDLVLRPPNNSNSKVKNSGEGTVAFQDTQNGGGTLRQQKGANNNNTGGRGRNNKSMKPAAETLIRDTTIDNSRDGDDDDLDPLDVGNGTLMSDELSWSLDAADMSTPVDNSLDGGDDTISTSARALEKKRFQEQQKAKLLQQNSIKFLSAEHMRSRPRDGLSESNPVRSPSKALRRRSDSTLLSSGVGSSAAASSSCVALNTLVALEDLEKEIVALKTKEALLQGSGASISAVDRKSKSTGDRRQEGGGPMSPRREAKILLVSSSALPTQFYDSPKTRNVLRTYLTSSGLEFDEMIEYGFPSEAFMNDDNDDDDPELENSSQQQEASLAAELVPSCRFLTLRITLTPWHARADELTLYGPRTAIGRQLQFKAMVNRFFSRPGNTTTTAMTVAPPSSPSSLTLVGGTGSTASPEMKPQRSVDALASSTVSLSALDTACGTAITSVSTSRDATSSRPSSRASESRNHSRANSRASSPRRDRSSPPSSHRGSPATTDHCGSNITPLLPSHIISPSYVSSRVPTTTKEVEHSPRVGRRLFSPTPSSSSPHSMIPLPVASGSTSQPPRKGSLSALSTPLGSQQQQQQQQVSSSSSGHTPMIPPRRKGSTPALFFTPTPSSDPGLRHASSTGREVYPSPSSRAAQTYGFSSPSRRPSDQSDTISISLASSRLNTSGGGYLREKASFDTEPHNKRQRSTRYPHSIHIKQQQQQQHSGSSPPSPFPSPSPCPSSSSNSGASRSRQGSHSRLRIPDHHQQKQHPVSLPFSKHYSEEQIYECHHVAGLDNIYKKATSQATAQPLPAVEKSIHPLQTVPHQSPQQHQQQQMRHETRLFHLSSRRDGKGDDEGRRGVLSSLAVSAGGSVATEQTPLSAAPPRIQAKNLRRRASACGGTGVSRNGPAGSSDRARRQDYSNMRREEEEIDECEVYIEDISFDGVPVDGRDNLDDEEQQQREREAMAAARVGGCWRPIECHQTSTMKTFAFP
ncbi:hypothetical protein BG015_009733 [Linnemannia schmuckeri]|uniref:Uncharacterized protein n=1 Tax=Linnemannia schmuckeri TaxID=64567 RepID=A0A9P5RYL5_9FUNG|nr:hypothetical protein BG015_009733 [Linnemannia schmuckeri]